MTAFGMAFTGAIGTITVGGGTIEALTYADFKNAEYQDNGSPVALGDLIEVDGDWGQGSPLPTVTAGVGIVTLGPLAEFRFIASELADTPLILIDAVFDPSGEINTNLYNLEGAWDYSTINLSRDVSGSGHYTFYDNAGGSGTDTTHYAAEGFNRIAILYGDTEVWVSINGGEAVVYPSDAPLAPYTYLWVAIANQANGVETTLEKIAAYPSDDIVIVDLPALSAVA